MKILPLIYYFYAVNKIIIYLKEFLKINIWKYIPSIFIEKLHFHETKEIHKYYPWLHWTVRTEIYMHPCRKLYCILFSICGKNVCFLKRERGRSHEHQNTLCWINNQINFGSAAICLEFTDTWNISHLAFCVVFQCTPTRLFLLAFPVWIHVLTTTQSIYPAH